MRKICIFIIFALSITNTFAQDQCLTVAPSPPSWFFEKSANKSASKISSSFIYTMNIYVHIVRSSNGQGLSNNVLSTIISSLNSSFQGTNINFILSGSEFINNDYYYTNMTGKESQLFSVNPHCAAIDIYVLGQSTTWGAAGYAQNIPSTALIVHGNYYNTSSLPHEMGHCLGLYHTHHGTVNEGGGDFNQCAELVNGSNATTCGDYISDTPADPSQWSSNSCNYIGTGVDANGNTYNPDALNLMSYAYKPCRNTFSSLQANRMKDFIDISPILQNALKKYISGSTNLCSSGGQYSVVNAPANSYVQWSYDTTKITSYYGGNTWIALRAIGNGEGWVEACIPPVTCGDTIHLPRMTVWAGIPTAYSFYTEVNGQEVDYYDVALICPNITNCFDSWPYVEEMGTTNFNWHLPSWYSPSGGFGANGLCFNANGTVGSSITADVTNSCGTGYGVLQIYFGNNGCSRSFQYTISPNPASSLLTVEQLTAEEAVGRTVLEAAEVYDLSDSKDADDGSYTVEIWHEKKGKVKAVTSKKKEEIIDVSGLEKGYYILHIRTKGAIYKEHLLVK